MTMDGDEAGIKVRRRKGGTFWRWKVCRVQGGTRWKRIKRHEARIRGLEVEIETRNCEYEELKEKYEALKLTLACEMKKNKAEHEVEALRQTSHELSSKVGKDGPTLKVKLEDLEVDPQSASRASSDSLATPVSNVPSRDGSYSRGLKSRCISGTRAKRLSFAEEEEEEDEDHVAKMAPSTPGYPAPSYPGFKISSSARSSDIEEEEAPVSSSQKSKSSDLGLDYNTHEFIGKTLKMKIASNMDSKFNWELHGDMLAAFEAYPEVCMMAVCVLYRQQTLYERMHKITCDSNGRGFSQDDAYWGSKIAEFLTDGNLLADMNKSVEELRAHFASFDGADFPDCDGYATCQRMAIIYHKQLFEIYQKKHDPFWQAAPK